MNCNCRFSGYFSKQFFWKSLFICLSAASLPCISDTITNYGSNAYTGQIVIDGKVVGDSGIGVVKGSGKSAQVSRKIGIYKKLNIDGTFDVYYQQDKHYSLTINGDDNIIPLVQSRVIDQVLLLSIKESFTTQLPIKVTLTSPNLEAIRTEGSSDIILNAINSDHFVADLEGTGNLTANGRVSSLTLNITGTGDVQTKALIADVVDVSLEGTSEVQLTAKKQLTANVSGAGEIVYYGEPVYIDKKISGAGDIISGD